MLIEAWELHWKMHKVSKFPVACMPIRWCLSRSAVSREMDWDTASQITGFDPFGFLFAGVHKVLGVTTKVQHVDVLRRRITAACETVTPASGHLLGHQGPTCGHLLRIIKTWILSTSFRKLPCFYLHYFRKYKTVLPVEILPGTLYFEEM
jgi:hypothetical protein